MPAIRHREYEGGIPGKWETTTVSAARIRAAELAYEEFCKTCSICGAAIDDGEQGCPTPEVH
jgi:hypothetical protein